jgi:hypothetical protein
LLLIEIMRLRVCDRRLFLSTLLCALDLAPLDLGEYYDERSSAVNLLMAMAALRELPKRLLVVVFALRVF